MVNGTKIGMIAKDGKGLCKRVARFRLQMVIEIYLFCLHKVVISMMATDLESEKFAYWERIENSKAASRTN